MERVLFRDRVFGLFGKFLSVFLIVTTQSMVMRLAYAQDEMMNAVAEANAFSRELLQGRSNPTYNSNGELLIDGQPFMSKSQIVGQQKGDYLPADPAGSYGSDSATLIAGQSAKEQYDTKTLETATTSGERAYHILKKSHANQRPDLSDDPMWANTDHVLDNLVKISEDFASCTVSTELVSTGSSYHVPKYETCERLPALEENFEIYHDYKVGVLKHKSGPINLLSCGDGCMQVWVGTVGNDYWGGWCTVYEETMSIEVIQPNAITYAKLERSKFDDYHQVYINDNKIYNGPNANFPPETRGACELSKSWDLYPNINVTNSFVSTPANGELKFKTRTSVAGDGEGYSSFRINYDIDKLVYDEVWTDAEKIAKAITIRDQLDDGFCTGEITCKDMPTLDENGCATVNGIFVCESDFEHTDLTSIGISPFCKKIAVSSNCSFNESEVCWEDMNGNENCFDNDTTDRNTCVQYEENPECSYFKTECVGGADGDSGTCYVQEDTYDCGFTATTGTEVEKEVIRCDGKLQCVGESCYSSVRDSGNTQFGEANAYLEMLRYARGDMTCEGIPDAPYNEESPPDRYTPVPTCDAGYTYNKKIKQCLKKTGCDYSDNDFYAASYRNGIQVLKANSVIANDPSIPVCVPIVSQGGVYTCGNAKKKIATDTFYEVCTNDAAPVIPASCPDASHSLNPTTGYCEIPPIVECEDGYDLTEGDIPFSLEDDFCTSQRFDIVKECQDGYSLVGEQCEKTVSVAPTLSCSNGYTLNGTQCSKHNQGCRDDSRNFVRNYYSANCHGFDQNETTGFWDGEVVSTYTKGNRNWSRGNSSSCRGDRGSYGTKIWGICVNFIQTKKADITCEQGFSENNGQCERTTVTDYIPTCPDGFGLSNDQTYCVKTPEKIPVTPTCPSLYPVWNQKELRCVSAGLSPLVMNNADTVTVQVEPSEYQHVISLVLAPFESMLKSIVPISVASSEQVQKEPQVTQESMQSYIGQQLMSVANSLEEDNKMAAVGRSQLSAAAQAQFGSASTTKSSASTYSAKTSSGTSNVTCDLFKGKASECKIAVGGMQNCCDSPVATTLADYINLGRKTLELDALTGQVFGLDSYTGAWDAASNLGSAAYEGIFSSGADVVAETAIDGATEGIVAQMGQMAMNYTNDFLINTFGKDAASMLFTSAGAGTTATASPALAAAGSALMVVYYVYLAYVVFNLLINIIFKCTDDEFDLAMKRELLSTHYIGSYCSTDILGLCVEKRNVYCQFDSPMSRIMMEQIYKQPQMGLSWGSPENPQCKGMAIDQMALVDWDLVNLDEWMGILIKTGNFEDFSNVNMDALTGGGSNLDFSTDESRDNVLKKNTERLKNLDVDAVRRTGYEEAWNSNQ